jgi:DedD protein
MLTDHETRREHDIPGESAPSGEHETQLKFPDLDEPAWLEDDPEETEEPSSSPLRGIWVGIAAAAVTFVLVFAVPQWLGWYDVGPASQRAKREGTAEGVIAGVTAKPSGSAVDTAPPAAAPSPAPAALPPVSLPKAGPATTSTPPAATATGATPSATTTPPVAKASATAPKPATPAPRATASASKRTFTIQIAAFKDAKQAGRLAARVKSDGYPADVRRVESTTVPWVVRVGSYATREQAESARDALAKKGFRGFIL